MVVVETLEKVKNPHQQESGVYMRLFGEPLLPHKIIKEAEHYHNNFGSTAVWIERQLLPGGLLRDDKSDLKNFVLPSVHMDNGLLGFKEMVDLQENHRDILSMNSGRGYFEEVLVRGYGIDSKYITIVGPCGVEAPGFTAQHSIRMDLLQSKWPLNGRRYDYVLIGGPLNIPSQILNKQKQAIVFRLMTNSLRLLKEVGEIRMDFHGEKMTRSLESVCDADGQQVGTYLRIVDKKMQNLEAVGEMLRKEHPKIEMAYDEQVLVVARGKSATLPDRSHF